MAPAVAGNTLRLANVRSWHKADILGSLTTRPLLG